MCPVCGARIWRTPRPNEEIVCSHCKFRLHLKRGETGIPTNELEVVEQSLGEFEAEEKWRREHPEYYATIPQRESVKETPIGNRVKHEIKRGRSPTEKPAGIMCGRCHRIIDIPNPRFCPNCGVPVRRKTKEVAPLTPKVKVKTKRPLPSPAPQISKCMVCNTELSQRDDVVLCPHCHNLAHRNHLIEWLRTKKRCPSCGKDLDEAYYK
jgi:rRNA maturation endonuclease Nob1